MRILIIKTSSLGDIIHALPVLDYLRQAAPDARIDWVVDEAFQDLLAGNPLLNRVITVAMRRWKRAPFSPAARHELPTALHEIRKERYDLVFDLQGNIKSGLICLLARSPRKIGFSRENLQERFNLFCTTEQAACLPADRHIQSRYLRVVSAPFSLDPGILRLSTDIATSPADDAATLALTTTATRPLILLHTGTTWTTKLWHREGWIQLGTALLDRLPTATLLLSWGNPDEQQEVAALAGQLGDRAVVLQRLTLRELVALLKRCDLAVGGDTGPIHLAAAVGTPTVSFYRCTDGTRNGPRGERQIILQSPLSCTACLRKSCERDEECRHSIGLQEMLEAVLNNLAPRGA